MGLRAENALETCQTVARMRLSVWAWFVEVKLVKWAVVAQKPSSASGVSRNAQWRLCLFTSLLQLAPLSFSRFFSHFSQLRPNMERGARATAAPRREMSVCARYQNGGSYISRHGLTTRLLSALRARLRLRLERDDYVQCKSASGEVKKDALLHPDEHLATGFRDFTWPLHNAHKINTEVFIRESEISHKRRTHLTLTEKHSSFHFQASISF